jgi:hypothetical protein
MHRKPKVLWLVLQHAATILHQGPEHADGAEPTQKGIGYIPMAARIQQFNNLRCISYLPG